MSINQIKQALRRKFGDRKYRITRNGEIHVYGTMPNTNQEGWWQYGWIDDAETMARIESL
jgi:hypothetical protein